MTCDFAGARMWPQSRPRRGKQLPGRERRTERGDSGRLGVGLTRPKKSKGDLNVSCKHNISSYSLNSN